jgi:hypothetical protein
VYFVTDWFIRSKLKMAVAAYLIALALLVFHQIDSAQWVTYTTWVLGLYFSANVAEAVATKKSPDIPG